MNARQQAFRDRGLCTGCGDKSRGINPNTNDPYSLCQKCMDKVKENTRRRQAALRRRGLCQVCGKESKGINLDTKKMSAYCHECNDRNNQRVEARRKRYKQVGRCRNCGQPAKESFVQCELCLERNRERMSL